MQMLLQALQDKHIFVLSQSKPGALQIYNSVKQKTMPLNSITSCLVVLAQYHVTLTFILSVSVSATSSKPKSVGCEAAAF